MSKFSERLREEINRAQDRRGALTLRKISYVAATFGIGAIPQISGTNSAILFLAPVIAFAFDLYIAGEDFGIKRAGGFLGRPASKATSEEQEWEKFVKKCGDPFSKFANPFLSVVALIAAGVVLWPEYHTHYLYAPWVTMNVFFVLVVWLSSHVKNEAIKKFEEQMDGPQMAARINHRKLAFERYDPLCAHCGFGIPDVLKVAHIDGDRHNNDIGNLVILCPNCHKMLDLDLISKKSLLTRICG